MDRLLKMSQKLQHLHSTYSASCPERFVLESDSDLGGFQTPSDRRKDPVHTPAFLVPAVVDCLRSSPRFNHLVLLVPGEADVYCAQHVFGHGGCVITSDSDLLLHDLGSGSVILFRDIDLLSPAPSTPENEKPFLSTFRYIPQEIAKRLKVSSTNGGMVRFGFELLQNPHASLSQTIDNSQRLPKDQKAFAEFSEPYQSLPEEALSESETFSKHAGQILDPRICEIVLQSASCLKQSFTTAVIKSRANAGPPQVFLPLLFDCPAKSSAWDSSTKIRQLAYTLLLEAYPDPSWPCVREFRRIQSLTNKGRKVDLPRNLTTDTAAALVQSLDLFCGEFEDPEKYFFCFALHQDLESSISDGKDPSSLASLRNFFQSGTDVGQLPWMTIHLVAQLQATFYSLRLLYQIIQVTSAGQRAENLPSKTLGRLEAHLGKLPGLAEYPTVTSLRSLLEGLKRDNHLGRVASLLGIDASVLSPAPLRRSNEAENEDVGRKKRKTGGKRGTAPRPNVKRSTNPFDILGDN